VRCSGGNLPSRGALKDMLSVVGKSLMCGTIEEEVECGCEP
jgi:hypothetical protein